jgi:hypothetical protein
MKRKTIKNLSKIFQLVVVCLILWLGTFGNNEICINFIYFLNFLVSLIFFTILFAKESFLEDPENYYTNEYIVMASWLFPTCILIAGGWLWSGIFWFFTWCLCHNLNKELKDKIEKEDRIKEFKGE